MAIKDLQIMLKNRRELEKTLDQEFKKNQAIIKEAQKRSAQLILQNKENIGAIKILEELIRKENQPKGKKVG